MHPLTGSFPPPPTPQFATRQEQLQKHQSGMHDKDKLIERLTAQLEALTALKKEHEELLLVKFQELLNAKKAKIRELSRELELAVAAAQDGRA